MRETRLFGEGKERETAVEGLRATAGAARRDAASRPRSAAQAKRAASGPPARGPFLLTGSAENGISVEGTEAVLRQDGGEVERASMCLLGRRTPADHVLTALFPERVFCYSEPFAASRATATVGPADLLDDLERRGLGLGRKHLYEPSLLESFDGEIRLSFDGGGELVASFREWRKEVANLDHFPARYRRVVDLSLPRDLVPRRSDTVLLARLARLACDLVAAYVESGGETASLVHDGPLSNLFRGGEAPPPLFAPALFGRRLTDVYDDLTAVDGADDAGDGRSGARDALLPG